MNPIHHEGYVIEIITTPAAYKYNIYKDMKLIVEGKYEFPFPTEAEIHAKLYINRLIGGKDGWLIS
jgi:hypothetical protein